MCCVERIALTVDLSALRPFRCATNGVDIASIRALIFRNGLYQAELRDLMVGPFEVRTISCISQRSKLKNILDLTQKSEKSS